MNKLKKTLALLLSLVMILSLLPAVAFADGEELPEEEIEEISERIEEEARAEGTPVTTEQELKDAIANATSGDTITLGADVDVKTGANTRLPISKSMTIDGNGHTITINNRGFGVGMNATSDIDVTFKNVTIKNANSSGRCIDTRGNLNSLTLDHVVLDTQGSTDQYNQPLTIGGNQATAATINITNSTIQTNTDAKAYYAIITFNPVNMTITDSTIKGWACIYAKGADSSEGSHGSVFTITDSTLESKNVYPGKTNAFSAIQIETTDVAVSIENSRLNITAASNQKQGVASFGYDTDRSSVSLGAGNTVTLTGEKAVVAVNSGNYHSSSGIKGEISVSGGTFNVPVDEAYVAEGYKVVDNNDGTWTVTAVPMPKATVKPLNINDDDLDERIAQRMSNINGDFIRAYEEDGATKLAGNFDGQSPDISTATKDVFVFDSSDENSEETNAVYGDWLCDFTIEFDRDVQADSVILTGAYGEMLYSILLGKDFEANKTKQFLISSVGFDFTYNDILNVVQSFLCTAINIDEANIGTTANVSLVMWPTDGNKETDSVVITTIPYEFTRDNLSYVKTNGVKYRHFASGTSDNGFIITSSGETNTVQPVTVSGPHFAPIPPVAKIDDVKYTTLAEAVAAVPDNTPTTITMIADVTDMTTVTIGEGQNITLDLNGHKVATAVNSGTGTSTRHYYAIDNYGQFTLEDNVGTGSIEARGVENLESGIMTVNGGKIVAVDANGGAAIWNEATLNFNDGVLKATYSGDAVNNVGPGCLNNRGTAIIKNGTFDDASVRCYAICNFGDLTINNATVSGVHGALTCDYGKLVVNGGSFTATNYYGLWITNDGNITDVTVNGGTFRGGSTGIKALYASVDDGKQDCSDATICITGGTFIGYGDGQAAVAVNKSKSEHSWGMNITGGVFSTNPDSSYVAEGYEAVVLTASNKLENETEGYYKVGKVTVTEPQQTAPAPNYDATYTADKAVNSTDGASQVLASDNTVTVNIKASGNSVAEANPATSYDLASVVADAIKAADTTETNLNVDIQIVSDGGTEDTENKTVTYEVHPEATVTVGDTKVGTFEVSNNQLNNASFTITLPVDGITTNGFVNVVHTHADGTKEYYYKLAVADGKVTITGVKSFSEFSISVASGDKITDANDASIEYLGTSLRRRYLTSDGDTVVNYETDMRFGYTITLPTGATLNYGKDAGSYFNWSLGDSVGNGNKVDVLQVAQVKDNVYTVYLRLNKVTKGYFTRNISTKLTVSYKLNGAMENQTLVFGGNPCSVERACNGLAELSGENNVKWVNYAKYLLYALNPSEYSSYSDVTSYSLKAGGPASN